MGIQLYSDEHLMTLGKLVTMHGHKGSISLPLMAELYRCRLAAPPPPPLPSPSRLMWTADGTFTLIKMG